MMPAHHDAYGYLSDLAADTNLPWFTEICSLAMVHGLTSLDTASLGYVTELFKGRSPASATREDPDTVDASATVTPASGPERLEWLGEFSNFKKLYPSLRVSFDKRVSIIFGKNGSGKSSLCEALKVLANPVAPTKPIQNVKSPSASPTEFKYKLHSESLDKSWTNARGFGTLSSVVKYFDTDIATKIIQNPVEPGRVISLTPFKLHVFDAARTMVGQMKSGLIQEQAANTESLKGALDALRLRFAQFKGSPLGQVNITPEILEAAAHEGEAFHGQDDLAAKSASVVELEKATTDHGAAVLKTEHRDLGRLLVSLRTVAEKASLLWDVAPGAKAALLAQKMAAQSELSKSLMPASGGMTDAWRQLLKSASSCCDFSSIAPEADCPLCRKPLGDDGMRLFKGYHELLIGALERDIQSIRDDLSRAETLSGEAISALPADIESYSVPADLVAEAKSASSAVISRCSPKDDVAPDGIRARDELLALASRIETVVSQKAAAMDAAAKGSDEVLRRLAGLKAEIEKLSHVKALADNVPAIKAALHLAKNAEVYAVSIPTITPVLKGISTYRKKAYSALVVHDFTNRLDNEYRALTERNMADFGVVLAPRVARDEDSDVVLDPKIGPSNQRATLSLSGVSSVLSEGELRMHALALFFAELGTASHQVVVFDDPISSFDYNYTENYCNRLRDFIANNQNRQVIVLTHNWEFFVQLQEKTRYIHREVSVQVLESCSIIREYSEKIAELRADIESKLSGPGDPSEADKFYVAGLLRRLVESVVNTHVFNGQRHQYKNKDIVRVSVFRDFTKLVPLLSEEARKLEDLYSKLSASEHDDLRNYIVAADKEVWVSRYREIKDIQAAIESRRRA